MMSVMMMMRRRRISEDMLWRHSSSTSVVVVSHLDSEVGPHCSRDWIGQTAASRRVLAG